MKTFVGKNIFGNTVFLKIICSFQRIIERILSFRYCLEVCFESRVNIAEIHGIIISHP